MATFLKSAMLGGLLVAGLLSATAVTAQAETYKFYDGGAGYIGAYNGAGTVYDATKALATDCPIEADCIGDYAAPSMSFAGSDGPVTATTNGTNQVRDDLVPIHGGLAVDGPIGDDQIDNAEILTLSFLSDVQLLGVGTLFATAHEPFGPGFPTAASIIAASGVISFLMSVDGDPFFSVLFATANNIAAFSALDIVGSVFSFMQEPAVCSSPCKNQPTFYVSGLITGPADVPGEVPIPAALPLFLAGLGVLGLVRRRKQKA